MQPMITFPDAGNYIVTMKATGMDGCEVPVATLNYYSTGNNGPWNLSVFPNPASDLVTIQVDLKPEIEKMRMMTFEKEEPFNCEIQLWNNAGVVKSFNSLEKIKQFSVNDLSKGLYYIKVIIGENTYTQTLFIN
ncbi:putative secreted protein (Por secretion system target) [Marinilabilia salmonicolor]|uniref:Putative secreted protein (Por secretion system target) n=1 Tax=Marinilabilia salmonicolor TaxID=989 RepID=A0A368URV7_9BACT|nr:putative secreted protein (Por secretion system target) [Marinilabilia salmonicolor]